MDDKVLVSTAGNITSRTIESMDDVVQALLEALRQHTAAQDKTLKEYAEYVKAGGSLKAMTYSTSRTKDLVEVLDAYNKQLNDADKCRYYIAADPQTGLSTMIFEEDDLTRIEEIVSSMSEPLYRNPQITLAELYEKNPEEKAFVIAGGKAKFNTTFDSSTETGGKNQRLLYKHIDDPQKLEESKWKLSIADVEYALVQTAGPGQMIVYEEKYEKIITELGAEFIRSDELKTSLALDRKMTLTDCVKSEAREETKTNVRDSKTRVK